MNFPIWKFAGIFIAISMISVHANCLSPSSPPQKPDSASSDTGKVNKLVYSFEAGYNIRRTDSYKDAIPEDDLFSFETTEEPQASLRFGADVMFPIKAGLKTRFGFAGFNFEHLTKNNSGYLDVEYYMYEGILGVLNPSELGDKLTVDHNINAYSLYAGYMLRPYQHRRLIGSSFSARLAFGYFHVNEKVQVSMDGNYTEIITPEGESLFYENEVFSDEENVWLFAVRPGLRMDLHIGKHVSLILPEISYEILLAQEKIAAKEYKSTIDDDSLIIPEREHDTNGLTIMFGISCHF